jgi:hypothetical protein
MLKIEFCTKNRLVFLGYVIFGKMGAIFEVGSVFVKYPLL